MGRLFSHRVAAVAIRFGMSVGDHDHTGQETRVPFMSGDTGRPHPTLSPRLGDAGRGKPLEGVDGAWAEGA